MITQKSRTQRNNSVPYKTAASILANSRDSEEILEFIPVLNSNAAHESYQHTQHLIGRLVGLNTISSKCLDALWDLKLRHNKHVFKFLHHGNTSDQLFQKALNLSTKEKAWIDIVSDFLGSDTFRSGNIISPERLKLVVERIPPHNRNIETIIHSPIIKSEHKADILLKQYQNRVHTHLLRISELSGDRSNLARTMIQMKNLIRDRTSRLAEKENLGDGLPFSWLFETVWDDDDPHYIYGKILFKKEL